MSSRKELKDQRRQERLEREQAEEKASQRRRRLQYAFGGLLAAALVAGVVVGITVLASGGDDAPSKSAAEAGLPKLPQQQEPDWRKAAATAGCKLTNPAYEGAGHAEKRFKPSDYKSNPPTSGEHFPQWYEDGIYAPGDTPELGQLVHTLEHGRINVQYRKGTASDVTRKLEALMAEQNDGYHHLLYENATDMPYEVAATAWTQTLGCERYTDKALDALRTFSARYVDKGPERVP
jgi:hypothetical protein